MTGEVDDKFLNCVSDNLLMFKDLIRNDFKLKDSELWGLTFFDWSTWEKESRFLGIRYLFVYALEQIIKSKFHHIGIFFFFGWVCKCRKIKQNSLKGHKCPTEKACFLGFKSIA